MKPKHISWLFLHVTYMQSYSNLVRSLIPDSKNHQESICRGLHGHFISIKSAWSKNNRFQKQMSFRILSLTNNWLFVPGEFYSHSFLTSALSETWLLGSCVSLEKGSKVRNTMAKPLMVVRPRFSRFWDRGHHEPELAKNLNRHEDTAVNLSRHCSLDAISWSCIRKGTKCRGLWNEFKQKSGGCWPQRLWLG